MRRPGLHRTALGLSALLALLMPAGVAASAPPPPGKDVIVLEGATSSEGIAAGEGTTFFAGDRLLGDIYRGDIDKRKANLFIDAPDGRAAVGMKADPRNDLLFVAGGGTGDAYVYNTETRESVAAIELTPQEQVFINDVTLTEDGAWFTNSRVAELYFVPVDGDGELGQVQTLRLKGPAAEPWEGNGPNGIAAAKDGETLILAHTAFGSLFTVDPDSGSTERIEGPALPNVDGILVDGRQLWAVQNRLNKVAAITLADDLSSLTVDREITSDNFNVPTTVARFGDTLAVINAKFGDTTATQFEVVLVPACPEHKG